MPSSFISTRKYFLTTHYNTCRPFLLLGSWASLAAFILMVACLYPYPATAMELATIFVKLLFLSNAVVLVLYFFIVTIKGLGLLCIAWLRSKVMTKMITEDRLTPDLFPSLSPMILAEPV